MKKCCLDRLKITEKLFLSILQHSLLQTYINTVINPKHHKESLREILSITLMFLNSILVFCAHFQVSTKKKTP